MKQMPGVIGVRDYFSHLLQRPGSARMRCHVHMPQTAAAVLDDDEHVQQPKRRRDGDKEVARKNALRVVLQEDRPALITRGRPGGRLGRYLRTVRGETRTPSLSRNRWQCALQPRSDCSRPSAGSAPGVLERWAVDRDETSFARRVSSLRDASERLSPAARPPARCANQIGASALPSWLGWRDSSERHHGLIVPRSSVRAKRLRGAGR